MEIEKSEDDYSRRLAFIKERYYKVVFGHRQEIRTSKKGRPRKDRGIPENTNSGLEKRAERVGEAQQPLQNPNYHYGFM